MIVAIVGSRHIQHINIDEVIQRIPARCREIVSGGAMGVDTLARKVAEHLNLPFTEFLPDYQRYGKIAPLKRNERIAAYCDKMIAIWDYSSNGTRNALLHAQRLGKQIDFIADPAHPVNFSLLGLPGHPEQECDV